MKDPIGTYERIKENFLLYYKTAFGTQFPALEREKARLLSESRVFSREPWIEPLPQYESSEETVQDLELDHTPGLDEETLQEFKDLASCGLVGDYRLHRHQTEMLHRVMSGKNCVVTAGTGSGKTEAFLLPLFAYLTKESRSWTAGHEPQAHSNDWWSDLDWQSQCMRETGRGKSIERPFRVSQRAHETRQAAVRALVIYPMNALVEDQLTRLRRALDSDRARKWTEENRKGNRIYFGRYNGSTPVPGHEFEQPN
jgi:ATP-dependent helicase YprA (DUF1998 family)